MSAALTMLSMGLVLGLRHATDSDHVVAVGTVVARERRLGASARIGFLWGLGHSATVLLVGGAMVMSGIVISDRAAQSLELIVAAMLIVLGVIGVRRGLAARRAGRGAEPDHRHPSPGRVERLGWLRPTVVGVVHGLAGSAAIALAVLATIRERTTAVAYLATFCVGTIVGMSLVTALIATPIAVAGRRLGARGLLRVGAVAGLASIGLGLWMGYEIGVVDGLFLGNAQAAAP